MKDPLEELRKKFPGRKIDVSETIGCNGFAPTRRISVDGRRCRARWNIEAEQDLKAYHGIDIDGIISNAMAEELAKDMKALSKWQQFKNAVNYKKRRT